MVQKLSNPVEQKVVGPHIRHPNPHPQYAMGGANPPSDNLPTAETVGALGDAGTSEELSRSDHQHPMPGIADLGSAGFMSPAQVAALATISIPQVIAPLAGGVLDITNGTLVWDITNLEQVVAA